MQASSLRPPPMRKAQRLSHVIQTKAPPVGGLDSLSPLALMPEGNAVELDNFISADSGLAMREGWYDYATGLPGEVRTVMSYDAAPANAMVSPASESELFAAVDTGIFLVDGGGDVSGEAAEIALSGATYAGRFSSVQFATDGGNFLVACSEIDGGHLYDGAAWMKMNSTGTPGPGVITGVDPAAFVQVVAWKRMLGFVERESTMGWFLPVNVVGGAAQPFDFGPVLPNGGALLALINWTQDAGAGLDDKLVAFGSGGDIAIYQGSDPTDPAAFQCVGSWYIGQPPVGRRCFTQSGGNIYILTQLGLMPVSQIVSGGLDNVLTAGTDMLQKLRLLQNRLATDFAESIDAVGWEVLSIPAKSLFLIARPADATGVPMQYAFDRHTLAWSRLLDIPARTFGGRLAELYAGTEDGRVLRVLDGYTDAKKFDGSGAVDIMARVTPAFSYFGAPDVSKQALMIRAVFLGMGAPAYAVRMNVDYFVTLAREYPISTVSDFSAWDSAIWDRDTWAPGMEASHEWRGVEGIGYALAPTLFISASSRTILTAIEFMLRAGGPL